MSSKEEEAESNKDNTLANDNENSELRENDKNKRALKKDKNNKSLDKKEKHKENERKMKTKENFEEVIIQDITGQNVVDITTMDQPDYPDQPKDKTTFALPSIEQVFQFQNHSRRMFWTVSL